MLLPVYLDHILFPTLKESQFITEVHHINGDGNDGGVVYCEMQEHESKPKELVRWSLVERLFDRSSGYASETGGRLLNLQVKLETNST